MRLNSTGYFPSIHDENRPIASYQGAGTSPYFNKNASDNKKEMKLTFTSMELRNIAEKKNIKVTRLPEAERPRERLIREGVNYLNNEELLAILLRTGTRKYPVKQLAQLVLKEVGSTEHWKNIPYEQLRKIEGIGPAHACSILAAIE